MLADAAVLSVFLAGYLPSLATLIEKQERQAASGAPAATAPQLEAEVRATTALPEGSVEQVRWLELASRFVVLGDREPQQALDLVARLPTLLPYREEDDGHLRYLDLRRGAAAALLGRWGKRDAPAAVNAALAFWRAHGTDAIGPVLDAWARRDPAAAVAWVEQRGPERAALDMDLHLLSALPYSAPRLAIALAPNLDDGRAEVRGFTYCIAIVQLGRCDPSGAVEAFEQLQARTPAEAAPCLPDLVRAWAVKDSAAAVAFVRQRSQPASFYRYDALQTIGAVVAARDQRAGADLSLEALAGQRDHGAADPNPRRAALVTRHADLLQRWGAIDRAAVIAWVDAIADVSLRGLVRANLSPELRAPPKAATQRLGLPVDNPLGAALLARPLPELKWPPTERPCPP